MTPESEALFNALVPAPGSVSTDHTDAIYDLLVPLHDVIDKMDGHLAAIDRLRRAADRAENDPQVYGWFERFKQNVDAGKVKTAAAKRALEDLSDLCFQMDSYAVHMRETMERMALPAAAKGDRVILTKTEHDALRATAEEANAKLAEALQAVEALKEGK